MSYLLDSGFLYSFVDKRDKRHEDVSVILSNISDEVFLPIPAITETAYFISKNMGVIALANFLDEISVTDFVLEVPVFEDYQRGAQILRQYNDANIDFVDAIIVSIAERLDITKILTIDQRHFRMFRPKHCPAFEIFP